MSDPDEEPLSNNEEEEQEEDKEESSTKPEPSEGRIMFDQSAVTLQVGETGELQINPGPNKSFQLVFKVKDKNQSDQIILNICDGKCKIANSQQTVVKRRVEDVYNVQNGYRRVE